MFKVGEMAVYPAHGVGVVESIEEREISGEKLEFFTLRLLENNMSIMIPSSKLQTVGLRNVINKEQANEVFSILRQRRKSGKDGQTWNRRYREYSEKIKTGSVYEIAEVLRDLFLLKNSKDLSFGERKMLDTARALLVKELSIAKNIQEESIEAELKVIFTS